MLPLSEQQELIVKKAYVFLKALRNPKVWRLLKILSLHPKINVSDLCTQLQISQSETSQLLSKLRKRNIVITERQGKFIYYILNLKQLEHKLSQIKDLISA